MIYGTLEAMKKVVSQAPFKANKMTTLNRSRFGQISAVEGIRVSREISDRFDSYDADGLSGDQRRHLIYEKYRKS